MLLCPLLCWAGWWLTLGQVTLGQVTPWFCEAEPWGGITTVALPSPCSRVLQHLCCFSAKGNRNTKLCHS